MPQNLHFDFFYYYHFNSSILAEKLRQSFVDIIFIITVYSISD